MNLAIHAKEYTATKFGLVDEDKVGLMTVST